MPFFGRDGGSSLVDRDAGITVWSSNCPAGVRRNAPSGLKVRRRKKLVKLSSPYILKVAQEAVACGARMAGSGGIGEGDRPMWRAEGAGEGTAELLKEDRRDAAPRPSLGGFIEGVLIIDIVGVGGAATVGVGTRGCVSLCAGVAAVLEALALMGAEGPGAGLLLMYEAS